ncbi:MAG: protein kinase, partial [Myxococcaceae bacterium]|nr:protein kinase [Myxococcaceae bacterium]
MGEEVPQRNGAFLSCPACGRTSVGQQFCDPCGSEATTFPGYALEALVGQGAAGQVFKARQRTLDRTVCVKRLLPRVALDPTSTARFRWEAYAMGRVQHPNVVAIYDVPTSVDELPFIVMEYVEGRSLRTIIREEAPIAPERAVSLVDQLLAGLEACHARDVVHRDLKPTNVLVTRLPDGREWCKLLDFGIAKAQSSEEPLTMTGMVIGTPGYMAPEQIASQAIDARADVFAVGVVLFELLTAERPFPGGSDVENLRRTLTEDAPVAATRLASLPPALDVVCRRALARAVTERFRDASAFRAALAAVRSVLTADESAQGSAATATASRTDPAPLAPLPVAAVAPQAPFVPPSIAAVSPPLAPAVTGPQASPSAVMAPPSGAAASGVFTPGGLGAPAAAPVTTRAVGPSAAAASTGRPPARATDAPRFAAPGSTGSFTRGGANEPSVPPSAPDAAAPALPPSPPSGIATHPAPGSTGFFAPAGSNVPAPDFAPGVPTYAAPGSTGFFSPGGTNEPFSPPAGSDVPAPDFSSGGPVYAAPGSTGFFSPGGTNEPFSPPSGSDVPAPDFSSGGPVYAAPGSTGFFS